MRFSVLMSERAEPALGSLTRRAELLRRGVGWVVVLQRPAIVGAALLQVLRNLVNLLGIPSSLDLP